MKKEASHKIIKIPITSELDLHTFLPGDTKSLIVDYISECYKNKIKELRIIHGKGKSVQKSIVHNLLKQHPLVVSFHDAPPQSGGWGATIVKLKN